MAKKTQKPARISELISSGDLKPIQGMITKYENEMEEMRKALAGAKPAGKATAKKTAKKNK